MIYIYDNNFKVVLFVIACWLQLQKDGTRQQYSKSRADLRNCAFQTEVSSDHSEMSCQSLISGLPQICARAQLVVSNTEIFKSQDKLTLSADLFYSNFCPSAELFKNIRKLILEYHSKNGKEELLVCLLYSDKQNE